MSIIPKKSFGQHFLKEKKIAERIVGNLRLAGDAYEEVLEIGPGPGVLTELLYPRYGESLSLVEIDRDLVPRLKAAYPEMAARIHEKDFLKLDLQELFKGQLGIIGNFPYNISSQILFKMVDHRDMIPEMVGMFQREVAQRVAAQPGTKVYGLISVWVQVFYEVEYLFTVSEGCFNPPPKVKSGVIRLTRKCTTSGMGDDKLLLQVIKAAFNQRRKTLRNALKMYSARFGHVAEGVLDKRAEQLGTEEFIELARALKE